MARGDARTSACLRLSAAAAPLVALPWHEPLASWSPARAPVLDVPLGAGRHVVRVVHAGDRLWALKELPRWAAEREHAALVAMQRRDIPAVRPAGLVTSDLSGDAVLITEYLRDSAPWRSLLTDLPAGADLHRARVCEAVAVFLVDLHRKGVFWGDCSLSNLLFRRDGHGLQPFLVDAETAEVRPSLTDGQRRHDLEILQDNLAGGLLDLAAELHRPVDLEPVRGISRRYGALWRALHAQPTFPFAQRQHAAVEVSRLNGLGYDVDEVRLTSLGDGRDEVRLHAVVSHRRHHAVELQRLTGLRVSEGQATVLLGDLRGHGASLPAISEAAVARSWLEHVLHPAVERLLAALGGPHDVVQAYCDLLEVRWLLSERAGRDVGDEAALHVLEAGMVPAGAAAELGRSGSWASDRRTPASEGRRTA